jgi:sulfide:quinone oxidoreductase
MLPKFADCTTAYVVNPEQVHSVEGNFFTAAATAGGELRPQTAARIYTVPNGSTCNGGEGLKQDYLQMRVLELAPQVYVSAQLFDHDIKLAAKQGVRSIMNNRADGESLGQPLSSDLAKTAEELGMTFVHFPVDPREITKQDVEEFAKARDELERPLLIFSRSGARSTKIWEMAEYE